MSTIRWVDLLSSESNLSHSVANNDGVNEKLKKKYIFNKENDLNNSFLNSYNGDLDNSNVGINLKIKNMYIGDNAKTKNQESLDLKTYANTNINETIKNNEKTDIEKKSKNNKQIDHALVLNINMNIENDHKVDSKSSHEISDKTNEEKVTNNDYFDKSNMGQVEKIIEKQEKEDHNVNVSQTSSDVSKNKSNVNAISSTKITKKRNSHNSSNHKVNKHKKIRNIPLDKKSIKNSFFSKYILEKNKNDTDHNNNKDEMDSIFISNKEQENEVVVRNEKGEIEEQIVRNENNCNLVSIAEKNNSVNTTKCKKRKDRNLNIENSISKYDYTQSHEVTIDENLIPLNPTKKMKNKLKEIKEKPIDNKNDKNSDPVNIDLDKHNGVTAISKGVCTIEKNIFKEENDNNKGFKKIEKNNSVVDPFNNVFNNNINLEKFNNFNNNFISYIGDIRSNFNETLNNMNSNRVSSRLKEIAVGKSTKGYKNYVKLVKYEERMDDHPSTPNAYENITNAKFQAKYNLWRKKLHKFDT